MDPATIPQRAQTLQVLRLMGPFEPILMLTGDDEGYGSRWTLSGEQVQPAIARFLMESGFIASIGKTEFGAIKLALTEKGSEFRIGLVGEAKLSRKTEGYAAGINGLAKPEALSGNHGQKSAMRKLFFRTRNTITLAQMD